MHAFIRNLSAFTVAFFIVVTASAQCPCPKMSLEHYGDKPVKVFPLKPDVSVAVCGGVQQKDGRDEYSEFILYTCGQLYSIDSWDGTQTCTITQSKDTLIVQELMPVANGEDMSIQWPEFYVTKYYYTGPQLNRVAYYRKDLQLYTTGQIRQAIAGYRQLHQPIVDYDACLLAMHRLFWAYVSGSEEAGTLLERAERELGPFDGAVAEEYESLIAVYGHYKSIR